MVMVMLKTMRILYLKEPLGGDSFILKQQPDPDTQNNHKFYTKDLTPPTLLANIIMSATATTSSRKMALFVFSMLLLSLCLQTQAQNYHFSNGWHPGGKRSALSDIQCHFRQQTKALIEKILDEEINRIITTCTGPVNEIADL